MEDLPVPLSRVELYLAKAAGMDVTVPEAPESRLEQFLAIIAGDTTVEMPTPLSLTEMWLAYVIGVTPDPLLPVEGACYIGNQKVDVRYFAVAAGMPGAVLPPAPQNRKEQYWALIQGGGGGVLKYATGTNITLTDVVRGIEELQYVYGDTFQQTYSGKNLINNYSPDIVASTASWTPTATGGTISNTATFGQSVQWRPLVVVGQEYTFHAESTQGGCFFYVRTYTDSSYTTMSTAYLSDASGTITKSFVPDTQYLYIRIAHNAAMNNVPVNNLQLEKGGSYSEYEPYVGGIPSPNPDYPQDIDVVTGAQTVTMSGKNLWPLDNSYTTTTGSQYVLSDTSIPTIPAGTYTLSGIKSSDYRILFTFKDSSNTAKNVYIGTGSTSATVTFGNDIVKAAIYMYGDSGWTMSNIQLEPGSSVTSYQAYIAPQTYTINLGSTELCKIGTYQDYIYKSGDDWYVHKACGKFVFDGTENWRSNPNFISSFNIPRPSTIKTGEKNMLSNRFSKFDTSLANITDYGIVIGGSLNIKNIDITNADVAAFKSWLSSNNVLLYYPLITPTDTKITDATLVGQLNAIDSAVLPKPIAYITVGATDPNLPGPLKISYYGEEE